VNRPALLAGGLAGLVLLAGCGGGPDAEETRAAHGLSQALQAQQLTARDADCVSRRWVGNVGTDELVRSGVLTGKLQPDPHNKRRPPRDVVVGFVDAYFDCVDFGRLEAQKFDAARPDLIDRAKFAACANRIPEAEAKQAMIDDLLGRQTSVSTSVNHGLLGCVR
jgi:hypothetical protein